MNKVEKVHAKVAPVPIKDVDTDLIIPAQFLTSISRDGFGENLFRRLKDNDPNFAFNRPEFSDAQIVVADHNFGCGSSREHAVWALTGAGIKAVIAKSFADIFYSNASKNGLLLITLPDEVVDRLLETSKNGDYFVSVDLETQTVTLADGTVYKFEFDSFRKHCLLNGLDDINYILSFRDDVESFRAGQQSNAWFSTRKNELTGARK